MMIIGEAEDVVVGAEDGGVVEDAEEGGVVVVVEDSFGIPFEGGEM